MGVWIRRLRSIELGSGRRAQLVEVTTEAELAPAVAALGLATGRPVIVVVGGASGLKDGAGVRQLLAETVVPAAEAAGARIVDGGTDCGVIRAVGQAALRRPTVPLVGVAATGTVVLPGRARSRRTGAGQEPLDPNHHAFLLVPGSRWGAESPWIARVATVLARGAPSITVVLNGGDITLTDVGCSIAERRSVLVIAGSGRIADRLAAGETGDNPILAELAASPLVRVASIAQPEAVALALSEVLTERSR